MNRALICEKCGRTLNMDAVNFRKDLYLKKMSGKDTNDNTDLLMDKNYDRCCRKIILSRVPNSIMMTRLRLDHKII